MLNDTFYLYARFKGSDAGRYYTNNKNYLIEVKVGRFKGKAVKIAHVHGYNSIHHEGSERRYENKKYFEMSWKVIKDVTKETLSQMK